MSRESLDREGRLNVRRPFPFSADTYLGKVARAIPCRYFVSGPMRTLAMAEWASNLQIRPTVSGHTTQQCERSQRTSSAQCGAGVSHFGVSSRPGLSVSFYALLLQVLGKRGYRTSGKTPPQPRV